MHLLDAKLLTLMSNQTCFVHFSHVTETFFPLNSVVKFSFQIPTNFGKLHVPEKWGKISQLILPYRILGTELIVDNNYSIALIEFLLHPPKGFCDYSHFRGEETISNWLSNLSVVAQPKVTRTSLHLNVNRETLILLFKSGVSKIFL